jgi:hypothetical protein
VILGEFAIARATDARAWWNCARDGPDGCDIAGFYAGSAAQGPSGSTGRA